MREMFTPQHGDRENAPNIGVVITDGESTTESHNTLPEADAARRHGIAMFAIGVGDEVRCDKAKQSTHILFPPYPSK